MSGQRGDAELASVMRKLLTDPAEVYVNFNGGLLVIEGRVSLTEEERQAVEEVCAR